MRLARFFLFLGCILCLTLGATGDGTEIEKIADTIVHLCVGGGRTEATFSRNATGGADLWLRSLDVKGNVTGEFIIGRSSVKGLGNALDSAFSHVAADQADKVGACLEPIWVSLLDTLPALPPRPAPPEQPTIQLSEIDAALSKFVEANVAFDAPDRAKVGKSQIVEARLSVTKTPSALISELTGSGKKESAFLRVGNKMGATLNGGGAFDVSPSGAQVQLISHTDTTIWTWTIIPKQTGPQFLILTFDAILTVDGKEGTRTVNTFRRRIDVEVGWPETLDEWLDYSKKLFEGLNWLWVTILVPIAAYVVHFWRGRKGRREPDETVQKC